MVYRSYCTGYKHYSNNFNLSVITMNKIFSCVGKHPVTCSH